MQVKIYSTPFTIFMILELHCIFSIFPNTTPFMSKMKENLSHLPSSVLMKDFLSNMAGLALDYLQDYDMKDVFSVRKFANWGLLRISHRETVLKDTKYIYPTDAGKHTYVYVLDNYVPQQSTIGSSENRTIRLVDYTSKGFDATNNRALEAASIIGHSVHGVAPNSNLILNKVGYSNISSSEFARNVGKALNDIITNVKIRGQTKTVLNLGMNFKVLTPRDLANVEQLIRRASAMGITVVKSAGNTNSNACNINISSMPEVITVGAIDSRNTLWKTSSTLGSNFGPCIDVFGPGAQIYQNKMYLGEGTAYAAAHVSGIAATYLSLGVPPGDIKTAILKSGTRNILHFVFNSPNIVAYNLPVSHPVFEKYNRLIELYYTGY
eukprot:NODE_475_length_8011_cov_0.074065.p3 type:complete len:380 gc:universal NODE_475_length_8011_cov_0.074065:4749-3610(-)